MIIETKEQIKIENKHLIGIGLVLLGITFLYGEIFNYNIEILSQTLFGFIILLFSVDLLKGDKQYDIRD